MNSSAELAAALARHQIDLPTEQVDRLADYCQRLWDWNSKLNLTRHTDFEKFVSRDLLDSQAFARHLHQGERILDVGTGGGVPGVVLAILRADLAICLSESTGKKARAVADIVDALHLPVPVVHGRAEDLLGPSQFNSLLVRTVASLRKLLEWFRPHWKHFDRLLILKGPAWVDERGEARHHGLLNDLALRKLESYLIPETGAESVLLQICPKSRVDEKDCQLRVFE